MSKKDLVIVPCDNDNYLSYICKLEDRKIDDLTQYYTECHHKVPRCCGGTNDLGNLIELFPEEHYYAHKLLAIENLDNNSLGIAWWMMSHCKNNISDSKLEYISVEDYAAARERFVNAIRGANNPNSNLTGHKAAFYGRTHSKETIQKIKDARKTRESNKPIKETQIKKWSNPPVSEETKKLMKEHHYNCSSGNNPRSKKVMCIETGEIFDCCSDAGKNINYALQIQDQL